MQENIKEALTQIVAEYDASNGALRVAYHCLFCGSTEVLQDSALQHRRVRL